MYSQIRSPVVRSFLKQSARSMYQIMLMYSYRAMFLKKSAYKDLVYGYVRGPDWHGMDKE